MQKHDSLIRADFKNHFSDIDTRINVNKKSNEAKLRDVEALIEDKLKLLELKIVDVTSEHS